MTIRSATVASAPQQGTPENVHTGYVALCPADMEAFLDSGELRPEIFAGPGVWGMYVPLDATAERAVETAIAQTTFAALRVTEHDTKWNVLKVSFVGKVISDMFLARQLHWSATQYRLECWTPIKVEWLLQETEAEAGPQAEVITMELPRLSPDDWGDRVLSGHHLLRKWPWRSVCQTCSSSDRFLWMKAHHRNCDMHCAECWHKHCENNYWVAESLHQSHNQEKAAWDHWYYSGWAASWESWHYGYGQKEQPEASEQPPAWVDEPWCVVRTGGLA